MTADRYFIVTDEAVTGKFCNSATTTSELIRHIFCMNFPDTHEEFVESISLSTAALR